MNYLAMFPRGLLGWRYHFGGLSASAEAYEISVDNSIV